MIYSPGLDYRSSLGLWSVTGLSLRAWARKQDFDPIDPPHVMPDMDVAFAIDEDENWCLSRFLRAVLFVISHGSFQWRELRHSGSDPK